MGIWHLANVRNVAPIMLGAVAVLATIGWGGLAAPNVARASQSCPPRDTAGFSLGDNRDLGTAHFCSYPSISGEDPLEFYCLYSSETGRLIQDQDAGFCPSDR